MMATEKKFIEENLITYKIYKFLEKKLDRTGFSRVEIQQTPVVTRIIVYAANPGRVIGKKGDTINDLTEEIKQKFKIKNPQISVEEIKDVHLEPRLVAKSIVKALESGKNAKRVIYSALREIIDAGALGAEITAAGKLASKGARAKKIRISAGYMPKAGEPAKLPRIASYTAYPKYGAIGVTVKILLPGTKIPGKEEIKPISLPKVINAEGESEKPKAQEAPQPKEEKAQGKE